MIDEEITTDLRTRMNVDRGQKTGNMVHKTRREIELPLPEPMAQAVKRKGDDAGVKQDFPA
ncbi:hypothetical protein H9L15_13615 [Sphingomonas daechungensis]|uniref:Uncharacterized protein n=1 Tax=Sphingomonas daechungensis TaxID=1176646 RepID=A0ABX6T413_9SPHN|nr:hypothetical protein H9L15_13615 [Sphingomonas daechungensis]